MNNTAQWFILRADNQEGPYSPADIRRLIESRAIDWNTLAFTEGLPDWIKLRDTTIYTAWRSDTWCIALGIGALLVILAYALTIVGAPARIALLAIIAPLYFLPTLIAARNRHHNLSAICALNLLLGWTFIGWALAFVWALTKPAKIAG